MLLRLCLPVPEVLPGTWSTSRRKCNHPKTSAAAHALPGGPQDLYHDRGGLVVAQPVAPGPFSKLPLRLRLLGRSDDGSGPWRRDGARGHEPQRQPLAVHPPRVSRSLAPTAETDLGLDCTQASEKTLSVLDESAAVPGFARCTSLLSHRQSGCSKDQRAGSEANGYCFPQHHIQRLPRRDLG